MDTLNSWKAATKNTPKSCVCNVHATPYTKNNNNNNNKKKSTALSTNQNLLYNGAVYNHTYIYIWLWRSRLSNAHTQSRRCLAALETCLRKFLAITLTLCSLLDVFLPATKTHCKWRNSNHIPANRRLKFTPKWNNIVMKLHFSTMYAWQDFRMTFCSEIFIKIVASCERGACVRPSCKDDQNTNFAGVFHCCCRWQFCTLDSLNVHISHEEVE